MSYDPELVLLKHVLSDAGSVEDVIELEIAPEVYSSPIVRNLVRISCEYYSHYGNLISREILETELERKIRDATLVESCLQTFDTAVALDVSLNNVGYWYKLLSRRQLHADLKSLITAAVDSLETQDVEEAYQKLQDGLVRLEERTRTAERGTTLSESAEKRWEIYLDREANPEKYRGILTGIRDLDMETNGAFAGELYVFAARHGQGKSVVLQHIGRNVWLNGKNVIYCPIEMSIDTMLMRFDSADAGIRMRNLRGGILSDEEKEKYKHALDLQKRRKNQLYFAPQGRCKSILLIEFEIREFSRKYGVKPDALVVDYLNIMRPSTIVKGGAGWEDQKASAEELRDLGRMYGIPVFTACQANRTATQTTKKHESSTEILAGSDWIGATADVGVYIYETADDEEEGTLTFSLIKVRNGARKTFRVRKNLEKMFIGNMEVTLGAERVGGECIGETPNDTDSMGFPIVTTGVSRGFEF